MKSRFELWMETAGLKSSVTKLLTEATTCYKANAHRAALLLSYIAFVEIIRSRLLQAKKPALITDGEWDEKRRKILSDDTSDQTIFDLLNRSDQKYFKLSDSLRTQINYWKDRRNDCAHLKWNEISASHVESFWLFIIDNINKITVVDSKTDLLNKFRLHYDDAHTPMNSDPTPIICQIPTSVDLCDFFSFLGEFIGVMDAALDEDPIFALGEKEKCIYIMLNQLPNEYGEIIKSFILQHALLNQEMFFWHPEYLVFFSDNPQFIRESWKNGLEKRCSLKAAATLLRNSLIPNTEIPELVKEYAYHINDAIPGDEDLVFLSQYGYEKQLENIFSELLSKKGVFEWWVDQNPRFILYYFRRCLVKKDPAIIDIIIKAHASEYRDEKSNKVYSIFSSVAAENPDFRNYINERAASLNIELPSF